MKLSVTLFAACLLIGCAANRRDYHRGWHDGFTAAEEMIEVSERVVEMRKEMRGESPKRFTP